MAKITHGIGCEFNIFICVSTTSLLCLYILLICQYLITYNMENQTTTQ